MNVIAHLFPKARAEALRLLFAEEAREFHLRDLARLAGMTPASMQKELANLVESGLVVSRRDGNRLYFKANTAHPLLPELRGLITKTTGMVARLKQELTDVPGIEMAFIFGSMAAGTTTAASDVDLLVLGTAGLRTLSPKLRPLAHAIGREINPHCLTPDEWRQKRAHRDAFVTRIASEPKLWLKGGDDELGRLG